LNDEWRAPGMGHLSLRRLHKGELEGGLKPNANLSIYEAGYLSSLSLMDEHNTQDWSLHLTTRTQPSLPGIREKISPL